MKVRAAIGIIGEVLITAGVLVLLFIGWQLGWVAVTEGKAQASAVQQLEQRFAVASPSEATSATDPPPNANTPAPTGDTFAILRIPRFGTEWAKPIYEGATLPVLAKGLGHYRDTQMPGQLGNFAVAGHRSGHGNPLIDIDKIRDGDKLIVETVDAYHVYTVTKHEIVSPTDTTVIEPAPQQPGAMPTGRHFTLTTCNPRFGNSERYIVFSTLTDRHPRAGGLPASELVVQGA